MTGKTLVLSYAWSDLKNDRKVREIVVINGGSYEVNRGTYCASVFVADVWDLDPSSVEFSDTKCRYLVNVGMASQKPDGANAINNEENGIELAAIRAQMSPVISLKCPTVPDERQLKNLIKTYLSLCPYRLMEVDENEPDKVEPKICCVTEDDGESRVH